MSCPMPADMDIDLDARRYMQRMLGELTDLLRHVHGSEEAQASLCSVGSAVGEWIEDLYREDMGPSALAPFDVARIFVDLKRRIGGDFRIVSVDDDRIVVANSRCPFGDAVLGREPLCMMTSNVFGRIAADHLGYARVDLEEVIARGHAGCRIVVHLKPADGAGPHGHEYYGTSTPGLAD